MGRIGAKDTGRFLASSPLMYRSEKLGVAVRNDHPVVRRVEQFRLALSTIISSELRS